MVARLLPSVTDDLVQIFNRDCEKLIAELELFESDAALWSPAARVINADRNLTLHVIGNLSCNIGATLGGTDFQRDRPAEFASRDIPKRQLVSQLTETKIMLGTVLCKLEAAQLEGCYPEEVLGYPMTIRYFLIHLYGHLNCHVGQVNYLRRVLHR